jgi:hypothetical protein
VDTTHTIGGEEERKVEGVGVMKDEDIKIEEIEVSHTLGGSGEVVRREGSGKGADGTLMSDTLREECGDGKGVFSQLHK